ncbi:MAG: YCF48-related protein [Bacteroidota bacterium]
MNLRTSTIQSLRWLAVFLVGTSSLLQAQSIEKNFPLSTNNEGIILDIQFAADDGQVGYLTGTCDLLLTTSDGGTEWTELEYPATELPVDLIVWPGSEGRSLSLFTQNFVYNSTDGGNNWQEDRYENFSMESLPHELELIGQDRLVYSDGSNQLFFSQDRGRNWQKIIVDEVNAIGRIHFIDSLYGWMTAGQMVLQSTDGGRNWEELYTHFGNALNLRFLTRELGFLMTDEIIFRSTDGGKSWQHFFYFKPAEIIKRTYRIFVVDEYSIWLQSPQHILKIDSRTDPQLQIDQGLSHSVSAIHFHPQTENHWIGRANRQLQLYQSREGSFKEVFQKEDYAILTFLFPDSETVLAYTSDHRLLRSADDGQSWTEYDRLTFEEANTRLGVPDFLPHLDNSFLFTLRHRLYRYDYPNQRLSLVYENPEGNSISLSMNPKDKQLFVLTADDTPGQSKLLRSRDKGKSWKKVHSFNFRPREIVIPTDGLLYAVGRRDMDVSYDDGENWRVIWSQEEFNITNSHFSGPYQALLFVSTGVFISEDAFRTFEFVPLDQSHSRIVSPYPGLFFSLRNLSFDTNLFYFDRPKRQFQFVDQSCNVYHSTKLNPYTRDIWLGGPLGNIGSIRYENLLPITRPIASESLVFPNPADEEFLTVRLGQTTPEISRVDVFGMDGRLLQSYPWAGGQQNDLNIQKFATGVYVFRLVGQDDAESFQILIK